MTPIDPTKGLLSALKSISPNASVNIIGNNLVLEIPFKDIENKLRELLKGLVDQDLEVRFMEDGIEIVGKISYSKIVEGVKAGIDPRYKNVTSVEVTKTGIKLSALL